MDKRKNWEVVEGEEQMSFGEEIYSIHKVDLKGMHPTYETAYEKSMEIVKGKRIQLDIFSNNKDCEKDKQSVIKKIKEINSVVHSDNGKMEAMVQAEILETMLYVFSKDFSWFGENTSSILPSVYDDLFLGNDLILEHKIDDLVSHTGLGIDITLGEESSINKLEYTRNRIKKGELGKVKYFQSPDGRYKGELNSIPHFVVGIDRSNLFKITDLWVKDKKEEIKNHPAQISLLNQMIMQCDYFTSLLNKEINKILILKSDDEYSKERKIKLTEKLKMAFKIYTEEKIRLVKTLEDRKKVLIENSIDFRNYKDDISQVVEVYTKKRELMKYDS